MVFHRLFLQKVLSSILSWLGCLFVIFLGVFLLMNWNFNLISSSDDMTFTPAGDALIINGETQSDSLVKFRAALKEHPETKKIILSIVPGSDDDDVNLKMAKTIRRHNLSTHLTRNSIIESGGIELFMGGVERTMERGAKVGVHSWSDDDEDYEAQELPKDHPDHKPYIKTYQKLGIPKSFYWFTVNAASSDDMYFMTEEELVRFNLLTQPILTSGL